MGQNAYWRMQPQSSVHDETGDTYVIWVTWLLFGIGTFSAVLRLAARKICKLSFSLEDYLVIFSLVNWVTDVVAIPYLVLNGTNAMTPEMRLTMIPGSEEWNKRVSGAKLFISAWFTYVLMLWALKGSILLFYARVTNRTQEQKNIKYAWYALAVTFIGCVVGICMTCRPFHKNWQILPDPGHNCTDGIKNVWVVGIFNIATDLMLLAIPLPIIFRLQTTTRRKVMLSILFSLGFFVIIATALRIHFTILGGDIQAMTFWCMVETCVAMIAANCPGLRVIFIHIHKARKRSRLLKTGDHSDTVIRTSNGDSKDEIMTSGGGGESTSSSRPGPSKEKWDQPIVNIKRLSNTPSLSHRDMTKHYDVEAAQYRSHSSSADFIGSNCSGGIPGDSSTALNDDGTGASSTETEPEDIIDIIIDCEDSIVQVHPPTPIKPTSPPTALLLSKHNPSNSESYPSSPKPYSSHFLSPNPFRRLLSHSLRHSRTDSEEEAAEKGRIVIHRTVTYGVCETAASPQELLKGDGVGGRGTVGCLVAEEPSGEGGASCVGGASAGMAAFGGSASIVGMAGTIPPSGGEVVERKSVSEMQG